MKTDTARLGNDSCRAWAMVAVLTLLVMLSMIDRLVLSLLIAPMRRDLHLTDMQISPLLGPSFSLFYSLVGLPAGYIVDRFNRRNLILVGALAWTAMTVGSAFAPTFWWLFCLRAGVGLGEAILSPAIYSMIHDRFSHRQRAMAFGINNIGSPLGTGAALITVGSLSAAANQGAFSHWPLLAGLSDWRTVLALVGLIGFPLALLLLTVREPPRPAHRSDEATLAAVTQRLRTVPVAYIALFLATASFGIGYNGLLAWGPVGMARAWTLSAGVVGPHLGVLQLIAAPLGLLAAGFVFNRVSRRGDDRAIALLGAASMVVAAGLIGLWPHAQDISQSWDIYTALWFFLPWNGVTIATLLARITPDRMMGKIAAINFLMLGLVGMVAGPTLVPLLAKLVFAGTGATISAVGVAGAVGFVLSCVALAVAAPTLQQAKIADEGV